MASSNYLNASEMIPGSELACEHWNFMKKWLEMVYIDAFIHGFKHGQEETEDGKD